MKLVILISSAFCQVSWLGGYLDIAPNPSFFDFPILSLYALSSGMGKTSDLLEVNKMVRKTMKLMGKEPAR